jgi:hypothetical protein
VFSFFNHTNREEFSFFLRIGLKVADVANSMAENSLSVFFTPLPFFLHPNHVLPSSTTSTISLLSFYGPLSVFPAPPCLSFSHLLACVFAPLCCLFTAPCLLF